MTLRIPRAVFSKDGIEINGNGCIPVTLSFDAVYDVTNAIGEFQVIIVNKTTAIT